MNQVIVFIELTSPGVWNQTPFPNLECMYLFWSSNGALYSVMTDMVWFMCFFFEPRFMGLVLGHKDIFGLWAASFGLANAQVIGPLMSNETCFLKKKYYKESICEYLTQKKSICEYFIKLSTILYNSGSAIRSLQWSKETRL